MSQHQVIVEGTSGFDPVVFASFFSTKLVALLPGHPHFKRLLTKHGNKPNKGADKPQLTIQYIKGQP